MKMQTIASFRGENLLGECKNKDEFVIIFFSRIEKISEDCDL